MDYSKYDTADLVWDNSFVAWVKHGEHAAFWEAFEKQYPGKREAMAQARAIITAAGSLPAHPLDKDTEENMWAGVRERIATGQPVRKLRLTRWYRAAALLAAISAGTLWWLGSQRTGFRRSAYHQLLQQAHLEGSRRVEARNNGVTPLGVSLPDGSSVVLQPGAQLSYDTALSGRGHRQVYLSGAAFFEVFRKAEQPFMVYANEMVIKVLGTSFSVKADERDSLVHVMVKTGRVAISVQAVGGGELPDSSQGRQVILTSNQQAILRRGVLSVNAVQAPSGVLLETPAEEYAFVFEDVPVDSVLNMIERAYGVHIHYNKTLLADCRLTASLTDEPLHEKIRLICEGLEAGYVIDGEEITINAKGCK